MDRNSLDCVAQDAHNVLSMVVYALQDLLMNCDTTTDLGDGITFCMDIEDMNVAYGALESVRAVRDRLSEALETV